MFSRATSTVPSTLGGLIVFGWWMWKRRDSDWARCVQSGSIFSRCGTLSRQKELFPIATRTSSSKSHRPKIRMTSNSVNLIGQEHLPPVLRFLTDPSFRFSTHTHSVETFEDGEEHTYTVVASRQQLPTDVSNKLVKGDVEKKPVAYGGGHLVSQISSTTTSERCIRQRTPPPSSISSSVSRLHSVHSPVCPVKYVMMVNVKFILLHRDVFRRKVQSMFSDEFASDEPLQEVLNNFHQLCIEKLRHENFHPRLSYCVGELSQSNSQPVMPGDMGKTIGQLAKGKPIDKLTLIINNINE